MAEVKNMLHKVQHLFLSTSVSAQSYRGRGGRERWRQGQGNEISGGEERNGVKREVGRGEGEKKRREMRNGEMYALH